MARVGTAAEAAKVQEVVETLTDVRTGRMGKTNRMGTRPLTKFEREALNNPVDTVYIYNISPIWRWQKDFSGIGSISLLPRKESEVVSKPLIFSKRVVRPYDGGNRQQRFMVEIPLDIAQDLLGCSADMPGNPNNDLTNYGCFYTVGTPLDKMDEKEREKILDDAELKHRNKCHEFVRQADDLATSNFRVCIGKVHKDCALYLHEKGEISELPDWVARRAKLNTTAECEFCGFENKRGVPKCRNCHEIIDQAAYDALVEKRGSKKK